jgi:hypothetical protein
MKRVKIVSVIFLSFLLITSIVVFGEVITKSIQVTYRNISILVNGKIIPSEQEPFIYQGRTFLPLRTIGEAVNKTVDWDNAKNQVSITDKPTEADQNFLSFPVHKIGERVEVFPLAVTIKKLSYGGKDKTGLNGGDSLRIDLSIENISDDNLVLEHSLRLYTLFDENGNRLKELVPYYGESIGAHSKTPDTAYIFCQYDDRIKNKALYLVYYPIVRDYNDVKNFNVFLAFDLGKIE